MAGLSIYVMDRTIRQLIDDVNSGKYFLPSFQRQYIWDEDDIKMLVDSIVNNYPIGTIILWKPSSTSSEIDPFSKPLFDTKVSNRKDVFYVLDGQQRLTSLLLLFNDWKITREGEEIKCDIPIAYHPNGKFYKSASRGIDLSKLVKAFCLQDISTLRELTDKTPEEQLKGMKNTIGKILDYTIPIYIMETYNEDENTFKMMAEAFRRVNKYGVRIGNLELMLSFLAGSVRGQLKEWISDIYENLYKGFGIDLQPIIRSVFSNFGLKQTQISKIEQFEQNINKVQAYNMKSAKDIFDNSAKAIRLVLDLIKQETGIGVSSLLPSQIPLVTLSFYLYNKGANALSDLSEKDTRNIINWFVLVSFNGYYSSQTDTKLDRDREIIDGSTEFPWDALLQNMQERGAKTKIEMKDIERGCHVNVLRVQGRAYLFLLYILLRKKGADDWNGVLLSQRKINELARHHIFAREYLEQNLKLDDEDSKEFLINNLGNITFIHKDINSEIEDKPPDEYLKDHIASAEKHFVPTNKELWKLDQYENFLQYRIEQIYESAKQYFPEIIG